MRTAQRAQRALPTVQQQALSAGQPAVDGKTIMFGMISNKDGARCRVTQGTQMGSRSCSCSAACMHDSLPAVRQCMSRPP